MLHKIVTVVIVGAALATTACNTVRGAARDVNSVANCTENVVLEGQNCCGATSATGSSAAALMKVLHAMSRAVEAFPSRALLIASM